MSRMEDTLIDEPRMLAELAAQIAVAPWVGIDTEADSLRSYPDKLCLIQVTVPSGDFLVDPMAPLAMGPFFVALRDRELIFHGADYDLRLLRRYYGFLPGSVFDTMLASRLLGIEPFGLAALVERFFGLKLVKSAQKADWRQRPLPKMMIDYARKDSHFLPELAGILRGSLVERGRLVWHQQLCARSVADASVDPPEDLDERWRLKGSYRLGPRALGILRELWHWREREAIEASKPPFFVVAHETLVGMAASAAEREPSGIAFPHYVRERRRHGAMHAMRAGLALPEEQLPTNKRPRGRRLTWAQGERMEQCRQRRDKIAMELGLDASLIATRSDLAELAMDWENHAAKMMNWQAELLADQAS